MSLLDSIVVLFSGKRISVVGPQMAGKTVLQTYLRTGELNKRYVPTQGRPRIKGGRQSVAKSDGGRRKLAIKKGHDVGGRFRGHEDAWKKTVQEADHVLYVFDASRALSDAEYARDMKTHCMAIAQWLEDDAPRAFAIVGTHCDLLMDDLGSDFPGDPYRRIRGSLEAMEEIEISQLALGKALGDTPELVLGSLASKRSAARLRDEIARIVE